MRKKSHIAGLLLLVIGVSVAVLYFGGSGTGGRPSFDVRDEQNQSGEHLRKEQLERLEQLQKTDPGKAKAFAEKLIDALPERVRRYYDLGFNAGIEDVFFYGQVVDQFGDPVERARVDYDIGGRYLAAGSGQGALLTDSEGRFRIKGQGGSLGVGPITHSEIDEYRYKTQHGDIGRGVVGFWGYQHAQGGNDLIWSDYSEESPYVFKVWRKTSENVATRLIQYDPLHGFSCDGTAYTYDFMKPKSAKRLINGEGNGQLRIRYWCKTQQHSQDRGDWSVEIEAVNGGIQESSDIYLNQAPEGGYQPVYRLEMKQGEQGYQSRVLKQFYFTAHGGQFYGSLVATFEPYNFKKRPLIFMDYKVNPTGSRALTERESR